MFDVICARMQHMMPHSSVILKTLSMKKSSPGQFIKLLAHLLYKVGTDDSGDLEITRKCSIKTIAKPPTNSTALSQGQALPMSTTIHSIQIHLFGLFASMSQYSGVPEGVTTNDDPATTENVANEPLSSLGLVCEDTLRSVITLPTGISSSIHFILLLLLLHQW